MLEILEKNPALIFSVKTFRPLWVFPWTSAVRRVTPFPTCMSTISWEGKAAAKQGHDELVEMMQTLEVGPSLQEPFKAIQAFCEAREGKTIHSFKIYGGHDVDGKITFKVSQERN